ncbi:MAG: TIGR03086 family metal-binding protein [Acidimicrobiales bacterium]|nr:TIGR03086 family metal-binding protein [Acidimicrobiales bacterium]MDP6901179.1 TIGR03086 family metal-binding protein [Acidimicrobiales bacterium]HJL99361.1 TIGR03086 family metal-binding protein [Acidimicrobiales bacterium]
MLSEQIPDAAWLRIHQIATAEVDYRIRQILPEYWEASTPCDEWDVYDLVAHCVVENMRASRILEGAPFEDVMSITAEVAVEDPEMAWEVSWRNVVAAFADADIEGQVELGEQAIPTIEFLRIRTCDLAVHAWDLAVGLGVDDRIDDEVVSAALVWARERRDQMAQMPELFDPSRSSSPGADDQTQLLEIFGREV